MSYLPKQYKKSNFESKTTSKNTSSISALYSITLLSAIVSVL